jgi:hypothetical protein
MVIFQLDVVHDCPNKLPQRSMDEKSSPSIAQARVLSYNCPNKLPQRSMDEKSSPSVAQARVLSFISHKMALAALRG